MPKEIPADQAKLADQLGSDNAAAVAEFVDGRIKVAIKGLRKEVISLVGQQKENIEAAKVDGSAEAAEVSNEGTRAVQAADQAVKEATEDPTPEKAEAADQAVKVAKEKVDKAESDLEAMVRDHDEVLHGEENGLIRRVAELEEAQTRNSASIEGLWVNVRANARAIAYGTTAGLARIARLTGTTFVVGILIWLFVVAVSERVTFANSWQNGIGIAAIVAGLVAVIMTAMLDGWGRETPQAEAQADVGVDIVHGGTRH